MIPVLSERIWKKRTVKAKCRAEPEHLQIQITFTGTCQSGDLPDNPLQMDNGDTCPVCDATVQVLDETREIDDE